MSRADRRRRERDQRKGGAFRVLATPGSSMASAIRAGYGADLPPTVVTWRGFLHLADELGGIDVAVVWLSDLVQEGGRPIAVNVEKQDGSSTTTLIGPRGWTPERLQGHAATLAPYLEGEFGAIESVGRP